MRDTPRRPLRVLILEDDPLDAELMLSELRRAGFDPISQRVDNEAAYLTALNSDIDAILSDFNMPKLDVMRALDLLKWRGLAIPFIIVFGCMSEQTAVQVRTSGVTDYLSKDQLSHLAPAVQRTVDAHRLQHATQVR